MQSVDDFLHKTQYKESLILKSTGFLMRHPNLTIDIITTGGTLEKQYDPIVQTTVCTDAPSPLPNYIEKYIQPAFDINYHPVCNIDSRDMTEEIYEKIIEAIDKSGTHIIITHGTDTMSNTAQLLLERLSSDHGKTIILIGSMYPYALSPNDVGFNLGYAIGQCPSLESGIYICMNAQTFNAGRAVKNTEKGVFEAA